MMPLKETNKNKKVTSTDVSSALSTEEIVSLLSKSNKDFIKESEISSNITNLFKKVSPSMLAKKTKIDDSDKNKLEDQTEIKKSKSYSNDESTEKIEQIKPELEKKYTEDEAKKMANEYAKKYYNNGYRLGVKKTNEELQKGDKALAVTLKNTADKLFEITPAFTKELNNSITNLVSNLCKEVLGYEIENNNSFFQEKIKKLIDSIENSLKDVKVFLNPLDHSCIEKYNKENDVKQKINFYSDDNLERGDIKIKSGSIEIAEIVSNKIKFAESQNEDFDDTKHATQNLSSKTVQEK